MDPNVFLTAGEQTTVDETLLLVRRENNGDGRISLDSVRIAAEWVNIEAVSVSIGKALELDLDQVSAETCKCESTRDVNYFSALCGVEYCAFQAPRLSEIRIELERCGWGGYRWAMHVVRS
jgi:hypothetical protein